MNYSKGDKITFSMDSRNYSGTIIEVSDDGQYYKVDCGMLVVFNVKHSSIHNLV